MKELNFKTKHACLKWHRTRPTKPGWDLAPEPVAVSRYAGTIMLPVLKVNLMSPLDLEVIC